MDRRDPPRPLHGQTAVHTEGSTDLFEQYPNDRAKVDSGYRGPAKRFPDPLVSIRAASTAESAPGTSVTASG